METEDDPLSGLPDLTPKPPIPTMPAKPAMPAHLRSVLGQPPELIVPETVAPMGVGNGPSPVTRSPLQPSRVPGQRMEARSVPLLPPLPNLNATPSAPGMEVPSQGKGFQSVASMLNANAPLKASEGTRFIYIPFTRGEMGDKKESGNLLDMAEEYLNELLPKHEERRANEQKGPRDVVLCVEGDDPSGENMQKLMAAGGQDTVYVLAHGTSLTNKVLSTEYDPVTSGGATAEELKSEKGKLAPSAGVPLSPGDLAGRMQKRVGQEVGKIKLLCCGSGNVGEDLVLQGHQKLSQEGIDLVQATKKVAEEGRAKDPAHKSHSFAHQFDRVLEDGNLFPKADVKGYEGYLTFNGGDLKSKASLLKTISEDGKTVGQSFTRAKDKAVNFPAKSRKVSEY